MKNKTVKKVSQDSLIFNYLSTKKGAKLTTKEITEGVNKSKKSQFTTVQVSRALNRLAEDRMIKKFTKTNINGNFWMYHKKS